MSSVPKNPNGSYQPESRIDIPPIYAWPPKPLKALRWLFFGLFYPWGFIFIALAFVSWYYLTPGLASMVEFKPGWIALLWLRNAALLAIVAGGLHWWFYMRRKQDKAFKFNDHWMATDSKLFLWGNQVWDNMFWSIVSGVTIWTAYEAITYWIYANGYLPVPSMSEHPVYFLICLLGVFFWGTIHFYAIHRISHWPPLYKISHELHHRNVNTGPWTGISMHPIEHLLYFSTFVLFWFVPVHPVIIVVSGLFMGIGPAPSHSGFDFLELKGKRFPTGDWYHQLHHQYFNFNYGNVMSPLDRLFGSWHDGTLESLQLQKSRLRRKRRAT